MKINTYQNQSIFCLCLINIALFYLIITWRVTGNLDRVITDSLFYSAIIYLFWQRQDQVKFRSEISSSFIGTVLITIVVIKSLSLLSFENYFIFLIPFFTIVGLSLITCGFSGILQYRKEFFLSGILFFPSEVAGMALEKLTSVTIVNAKVAAYLLYYVGFNVNSTGNKVLLSLPKIGDFQAVVNYSCSGMPMIILLFKLGLILIFLFPFSSKERILIPIFSIIAGFILGVIRVCILTLLIPQPTNFNYWHGNNGSQIFSTLAIMLFVSLSYWWIQKQGFLIRQ
ncbi:MAG: archaeosortase/exosortase family protein [Xenococcaceae cyanobacterium MO_188.B19]|nr:archaeosortase/exosortase family protein [Xenococcaceae cyanobacterium MO_188.B19]